MLLLLQNNSKNTSDSFNKLISQRKPSVTLERSMKLATNNLEVLFVCAIQVYIEISLRPIANIYST